MTSRWPYWCTKNKEMAAILVNQANPVGVEVFSYVNISFVSINLHSCWSREPCAVSQSESRKFSNRDLEINN